MPSFSDHAIILKRTDFDEAKRIITFLTRSHGKVSAVALGVRKVTSRKASHLELFNHSRVFLAKGKNLDIITEAATIDSFENIRSNLEKIGQAYYVVELVNALLPEEQKNYQVFKLTLEVLQNLDHLTVGVEQNSTLRVESIDTERKTTLRVARVIRDFEIRLLKALGFWSDEVHGRNYPSEPSAQARFNQLLIEQITERELRTPKVFSIL